MRTLKLRAMLRVLEMTAFCISSKILSALTPTSSLILSSVFLDTPPSTIIIMIIIIMIIIMIIIIIIMIMIIIIIIIIIIIYRFSHDVVTSGVAFDVMPGEDRYSVVETL